MNKIFTILLLGLFLINFSSACESWAIFKQGTDITLIQKCPSCSYVNITSITYPNGTIFLNDEMTKNGINFNFTLPDSSQEGRILYGTIGDKNGASPPEYEDLCIIITPSGNVVGTGESFMYVWILIVLAALVLLGGWLSVIIPFENITTEGPIGKVILKITLNKYMKLIVIWITSGLILLFLTVLTGMINNYIQFVEMKGLFTNIYTFLRIIGYGTSITIMIFLFINFYKDILWNKDIRKHGKAFVDNAARSSG